MPVDNDVAPEHHPLAMALAGMPEVWRSLLIDHEPDRHGRCTACRTSGTPGVPWPCTLRVAAEDARDLAGLTRPAHDPEGPTPHAPRATEPAGPTWPADDPPPASGVSLTGPSPAPGTSTATVASSTATVASPAAGVALSPGPSLAAT